MVRFRGVERPVSFYVPSGYAVVAAVDASLPHKWPEWDLTGAIWDFFERSQETEP